jgi:hypothetical protein
VPNSSMHERMSDDTDDAALLAALLATLDGDGGDSQPPVLVDSSAVGLPSPGAFLCADSDVGGPRFLLEAGDATLDLLSPPLEFSSNAPIDAATALQNLFPHSEDSGVNGSPHAATPAIPTTAPETGSKIANVGASSSTAVAVRTQGKKEAMKRNYDPNKARNERAKAIQGLRREVEDLTDQVKALRALDDHDANAEKRQPTESNSRQETASTTLTGAPPLWETICRNQLARRVCAERENVRLKRALDEQVNITKSLQRLIEKSTKVQVRHVVFMRMEHLEALTHPLNAENDWRSGCLLLPTGVFAPLRLGRRCRDVCPTGRRGGRVVL